MKFIIKRVVPVLILLTAIVTAFILYNNYKKDNQKTYSQYENEINEAYSLKDYKQTISLCNEALKLYSDDYQLYITKYNSYAKLADTEKAIGTLNYGYKVTGSRQIKEMLDKLDMVNEENVEFLKSDTNDTDNVAESGSNSDVSKSSDEKSDSKKEKYTVTTFPEINIPEVTTTTTEPPESDSQAQEEDGNEPEEAAE